MLNMTKPVKCIKDIKRASFTLFETVVALGIMSAVIVELASVQGNTIYFSEYGQNSSQAVWLAKRVMSQVEYYWLNRDFSELKDTEIKEVPFEDEPNFKYSLTIKNWKLPLVEMLSGGGPVSAEDKDDGPEPAQPSAESGMIEQALKQTLGDEVLKVAFVEVSWPEGAKSNSVSLTYLLTNQKKVDEAITNLKGTFDKMSGGRGSSPGGAPPPPGPSDGSLPSPSPNPEGG